jgi:TonB family protein
MKPISTKLVLLAGMVTSALLLGACASSPSTGHAPATSRNVYAPKTGTLATAWGQLPTYGLQPMDLRQFKAQFSWLPVFFAGIDNSATVDVLVNRDGTVRDVAIVRSSGDSDKDASVRARLDGVRITTRIALEDPAPYVFRTLVVFQKNPWETTIAAGSYFPLTHYAEQPVSPANRW